MEQYYTSDCKRDVIERFTFWKVFALDHDFLLFKNEILIA